MTSFVVVMTSFVVIMTSFEDIMTSDNDLNLTSPSAILFVELDLKKL